MSLPEPSIRPTSPLPPRLEAKPRPPISRKPPPSNGSPSTPSQLGERGSTGSNSRGKVKSIVSKFSHPETTPTTRGYATPTANGTTINPPLRTRGPRRAPTVKPKPSRASIQQSASPDQAPPLPMKRSRILRQQSDQAKRDTPGGEEGTGIPVSRSAPDGKEVELQLIGGVEVEPEHGSGTPLSPCCDQDCSCVCHLHRPGMKLIWVPINKEEEEEEEEEIVLEEETEEEERGMEGESEAGDEEEEGGSGLLSEERAGQRFKKAKFNQVLDVMIAKGNRRRSDPGSQVILASLALKRSQSPPIPPKRTQSPPSHLNASIEEEDSIYEATLLMVEPTPRKICKELDIKKPVRWSKLSSSNSEENTSIQSDSDPSQTQTTEDAPPAIPPRVPLAQDKSKTPGHNLTPVHRGGIALPQPTAEEWRSLHPSSPNHFSNPVVPHRVAPPPPTSPQLPHRVPPPQPPKTGRDDRRLSNISGHSINQAIKEQEEDGRTKGEKEDTEEDCTPVAPPRRGSYIDWESRLQDEPLYQTYRATVITKEIRRQTVCRNISKTSADYHMDWTARRGGVGMGSGGVGAVGSGTIPLPTPGQSTLWQDIPGVRDSGVLETLSPEQCKYQESMFEVLTSEASYLRSLRVLTEHFLDSRDLDEALIIRDRKTLFSNVLRVREVSERFLKDLEDRMDEGLVFSDICDIIHYHAQHNFPAYIDYVRNQIYQEKTYTFLMKTNVAFATVITRLQESPQCQRLPFMSFLLLPFQRITRIKMLIENILKRTKEGTTEEQTASKALDSVSKIIEECNTQVGKMKQVEELIHLSKTLEFDKLKAIPIISQTRFLEKRGEVQEMAKGGTLFNLRPKFTPVYLFLFNDLLIIATKKGSERFVVMDHAHRSLVQVQPIREDQALSPSYEHCFCLTLLENHQGRMMERLMKAPSQSDLHRWIAAFPNPGNHDGDQEEVIYDDWDCPQVQCVEQYIAQQADELTLEPTEIINVVRKTNEGLYEGIRLSDGQKGWFPVENVLEITNEHVRRRNLRERYRVIQAASIVTNKVKTLP
ncbi:rho guanine nucleotide exchange factor 15 isoform X1 [Salvelinus fontinalis]|uniref:rho guanine nucleotide exchange factor 15 isoform X1 n=1 Tax=Salvelinus fontinalis TaxID=8038 RepID=UPI002486CD0B|nr:rho guanine nucleotide exchange factor 15 isoform X1 [Salvelinus fontinalis]